MSFHVTKRVARTHVSLTYATANQSGSAEMTSHLRRHVRREYLGLGGSLQLSAILTRLSVVLLLLSSLRHAFPLTPYSHRLTLQS